MYIYIYIKLSRRPGGWEFVAPAGGEAAPGGGGDGSHRRLGVGCLLPSELESRLEVGSDARPLARASPAPAVRAIARTRRVGRVSRCTKRARW